MIGVNDAWRIIGDQSGRITDLFERSYRHLLEVTAEVMPHTGLVICEPFVDYAGHSSGFVRDDCVKQSSSK